MGLVWFLDRKADRELSPDLSGMKRSYRQMELVWTKSQSWPIWFLPHNLTCCKDLSWWNCFMSPAIGFEGPQSAPEPTNWEKAIMCRDKAGLLKWVEEYVIIPFSHFTWIIQLNMAMAIGVSWESGDQLEGELQVICLLFSLPEAAFQSARSCVAKTSFGVCTHMNYYQQYQWVEISVIDWNILES